MKKKLFPQEGEMAESMFRLIEGWSMRRQALVLTALLGMWAMGTEAELHKPRPKRRKKAVVAETVA